MSETEFELMDRLAVQVGVAGPESQEERNMSSGYQRSVLRAAIKQLSSSRSPGCYVELPNFEEWFEQNKPPKFELQSARYQNGFEAGARRLWNSLLEQKLKSQTT